MVKNGRKRKYFGKKWKIFVYFRGEFLTNYEKPIKIKEIVAL